MTTREQWLNDVANLMRPWFADLDYELPPFRVSIGFPGTGRKSRRIGECWYSPNSADGHHELFISPVVADTVRIAGVLAHELTHACVGPDAKHGPVFKRVATAIGLEGKMTATVEGDTFKRNFARILEAVGPYPGAELRTGANSGPPKQSTRMVKCECPECGYTVRTTRKWLEVAVPECPVDHSPMNVNGETQTEGE